MWFAQSDGRETRRNRMESKSSSIQPGFMGSNAEGNLIFSKGESPMKIDMIATNLLDISQDTSLILAIFAS